MSSIRLRSHTTVPAPGTGGSHRSVTGPGGPESHPPPNHHQQQQRQQQHRRTSEHWRRSASGERLLPLGGEDARGGGVGDSLSSMYPLHIQYQNVGHDDDDDDVNLKGDIGIAAEYVDMGTIRTGKRLRAERTRLEDYHVAYRVPLHVPDNCYRAYLQGRDVRGGRTGKDAPAFTTACCLHLCIGFSVVAIIFLCFVGYLIQVQPILMAGTLEKRMVQVDEGKMAAYYLIPAPGAKPPPTAYVAYQAAMAYFVCILLCTYALHPAWMKSQMYRFRHRYQNVPDHGELDRGAIRSEAGASTIAQFHEPDHHHHLHRDPLAPPGFIQALCNRCNYVVRQRLAEMGYYRPGQRRKSDRKTG